MKKINVFLSAPYTGMTEEELVANRKKNVEELTQIVCERYLVDKSALNIIDMNNTSFGEASQYTHSELYCIGKCISALISKCDIVVLGHGWQNSKGCTCEQFVSSVYGISCINLETIKNDMEVLCNA